MKHETGERIDYLNFFRFTNSLFQRLRKTTKGYFLRGEFVFVDKRLIEVLKFVEKDGLKPTTGIYLDLNVSVM